MVFMSIYVQKYPFVFFVVYIVAIDLNNSLCPARYDRHYVCGLSVRPTITLYGYTLCAVSSKAYDLLRNYHACIAIHT